MGIAVLNQEMLQKLFYFFLKKTGNRYDAEELTQNTLLDVIRMISNGYVPNSYLAWIWTIARKKYASWTKMKHISLSRYENIDISDLKDAPLGVEPDEIVIFEEQVNLLRREMSLLAKDYREITTAYYFDHKKISEISISTGLPEGTIKRKLFESRKNLKEGMQMARKNGQRAYAPEDIGFSYNVNKSNNDLLPWNLAKRLIAKNILLEAYDNPSSVEELSLALGVAAPYIEDELSVLVDSTIMKRWDDGKYETDFIIINKENQHRFYDMDVNSGQKFYNEILRVIEDKLPNIREIGFTNCSIAAEHLSWSLFYIALEKLMKTIIERKGVPKGYTKRPGNGEWEIIGYEITQLPKGFEYGSTCNRTIDNQSEFVFQKVRVPGIWEINDLTLSGNDICLLSDILRSVKSRTQLSISEQNSITSLKEKGVVDFKKDEIVVNFPVFNERDKGELTKLHDILHDLYDGVAYEELSKIYDMFFNGLMNGVPSRLINQVKTVVYNILFNSKTTVIIKALNQGIIKIPEGPDKSAITMYMII